MNLYQLTARYQQLLDQEELTPEDCAELEALHGDAEDHCIERSKYIRNLESELVAVEAAIQQMRFRTIELEKRIESRRNELLNYMKLHNLVSVTKSPLFPIHMIKNRVSVDDYDRDTIPEAFWRTKEKVTVTKDVDKEAVRKAIESGIEVPGARLVSKSRIQFK